jgi:Ca2+-binding RTX toxin-like protein
VHCALDGLHPPFGTDGDDVLVGTPLRDVLCGFAGDDQLEGGEGDDTLLGGAGDDVLIGGECSVGGSGTDSSADAGAEVERNPPFVPDATFYLVLNAEGRCVGGVAGQQHIPRTTPPRIVGVGGGAVQEATPPGIVGVGGGAVQEAAPPGGVSVVGVASVAAGSRSGGVRLGVAGGAVAVRRGVVRVRVSCSAVAPAELVLVAGSERIAHKRFTCRPPGGTVRVRLNRAGRRLVAREERVRARVLVLAAGRTVVRSVLLVRRGG